MVVLLGALLALRAPAVASAESATVTSFDGTELHVNFFLAANLASGRRAPTVMLGPGWGSAGDTSPNDSTDLGTGIPGVGTLRRDGAEHTGSDYPLASGGSLIGDGKGVLPITAVGGAGPVVPGVCYETQRARGTVRFSNTHIVLPVVNPAMAPAG